MPGPVTDSTTSTSHKVVHVMSSLLWNGLVYGLAGGAVAACCGIIVAGKSYELLLYGTRGAADPLAQTTSTRSAIALKFGSLMTASASLGSEMINKGCCALRPVKQVSQPGSMLLFILVIAGVLLPC